MASIFGHVALAFGIKQIFPKKELGKKALLIGVVGCIIPDLDVISQSFAITSSYYLGVLSHRGITHSILFALILSFLILLFFHKEDRSYIKGIFYFVCILSHGLVDSMTNGGEGIAFFIPFDTNRYFFPYRFIEVSPIGISSFFSEWGLRVILSEIKYIGIPTLCIYVFGKLLNKNMYEHNSLG